MWPSRWSSLADLVATYRRLAAEGITPIRCFNHGVATSMYFRDPDGNEIELSVEHFPTVDELNTWLATGDFDENPAGVALEPEVLAARVESGVPASEILQPDPAHRTWLADMIAARRIPADMTDARRPAVLSRVADRLGSRWRSRWASSACHASSSKRGKPTERCAKMELCNARSMEIYRRFGHAPTRSVGRGIRATRRWTCTSPPA